MAECIKCKADLPDGAPYCLSCGKKQAPEPRKHKKRANGTGNITKLSGNRTKPWLARKNGVSIGTYSTRTEAQKALERLTDIDVSERFNLTFKQVYDLWLPERERTISASAKGTYKTAYNHCQPLYDKKFRSLRHSDFQSVIIAMEEKGLSLSSCEKVLQLFGQMSDWAIREEIMQTNYAKYCSTVAKTKKGHTVFTAEDIKAIQKSQNIAVDIVLILLSTGCRPTELFTAVTGNCAATYFIGGSKTAAGKNRVIAVAPDGRAAYTKILAAAQGRPRLIDGYSGNKDYANFAKREFKELMKEIGREGCTPYDCRHTFITQATRSGIDPQILRRMVGHADLSTTDKYYTHMDLGDILGAISELDLTAAVCNKSVTRSKQGQKNFAKSS